MHKKDYQAIAAIISDIPERIEMDFMECKSFRHSIATRFCDVLKRDNPAFDSLRFLSACHAESRYSGKFWVGVLSPMDAGYIGPIDSKAEAEAEAKKYAAQTKHDAWPATEKERADSFGEFGPVFISAPRDSYRD